MQAEPPPPPPSPPPAAEVTVSTQDASVIVTALDLPLVLVRGGQREEALLRRAVFMTTEVTVVRPVGETTAAKDRYRWRFRGFLQRQTCFSSMTGLFACTAGETVPLREQEAGEAPVDPAAPGAFPLAEAAKARVTAELKVRATGIFETDKRTHFDVLMRSAGVAASPPRPPAPRRPPAKRR